MIDGVLVVKKERGYTSFDVVARLRSLLHQKKIGHLGTLDPEAEGVLPVCLGKAARLADLLSGGEKVYRAVIRLGVSTDTQDACGKLLKRRPVTVTEEAFRETVGQFTGRQQQLTPMYSARKIDGKKLVDLAREGKEVERSTAEIDIRSIEVLSVSLPLAELRVSCSRGTYIRTLCHDIGEALGCGGIMESLVREKAGDFGLEESLTLGEITALTLAGKLESYILGLPKLLAGYPAFYCPAALEKAARNGNPLPLRGEDLKNLPDGSRLTVQTAGHELLGLYTKNGSKLRPAVMFNRAEEEKTFIPRPSVLSLGKFDGLHLGHQAIVRKMEELAAEKKMRTVLFSFTSAPEALLQHRVERYLLTAEEKRLFAKSLGVDVIEECPFTGDIRTIRAETFVKDILIGRYGMREMVVGPDCCFGFEREGNIDFLKEASGRLGFGLTVLEKEKLDGEIISSTGIRERLGKGEMHAVSDRLGRPFSLRGRIAYGDHRGTALGFPTLNFTVPDEKLCPPFGVYAAAVKINGEEYSGMANLGVRPTVNKGEKPLLEVHLLENTDEMYGQIAEIFLLSFIREEKAFEDLEALKRQLKTDRETVQAFFGAQRLREEEKE